MTGRPRMVSDEEILSAFAQVVGRLGPASATLAAVGAEAGLSASALAQRFGSKRGLLLAFAEQARASTGRTFDLAARRGRSPLRRLDVALADLVAPLDDRATVANNLAFLQADLGDPELHEHAVAQSREVQRRVRSLLDAAVEAGELAAVDTRALARVVWVTYNGAIISWALDGSGPLTAWVQRCIRATLAPYRLS